MDAFGGSETEFGGVHRGASTIAAFAPHSQRLVRTLCKGLDKYCNNINYDSKNHPSNDSFKQSLHVRLQFSTRRWVRIFAYLLNPRRWRSQRSIRRCSRVARKVCPLHRGSSPPPLTRPFLHLQDWHIHVLTFRCVRESCIVSATAAAEVSVSAVPVVVCTHPLHSNPR